MYERDQIAEALAALDARADEWDEQRAWDLFAAAALQAAGNADCPDDTAEAAEEYADAMMDRRRQRIEARKAGAA